MIFGHFVGFVRICHGLSGFLKELFVMLCLGGFVWDGLRGFESGRVCHDLSGFVSIYLVLSAFILVCQHLSGRVCQCLSGCVRVFRNCLRGFVRVYLGLSGFASVC